MADEIAKLVEEGLLTMPFHRAIGLEVERIEPPEVELAISKCETTLGLGSTLHGGAALSLIYTAAGAAIAIGSSNYDPIRDGLHTLDMHIEFRAAPRTDRWTAIARVVQEMGDVKRVDCTVRDNGGYVLAEARIISLVTPGEEAPEGTTPVSDEMKVAWDAFVNRAS